MNLKIMRKFCLWLTLCLGLCLSLETSLATQPEQPVSVGLGGLPDGYGPYGTLFEPTNQYVISCSHWYPAIGSTLVFGNGQTRTVTQVWVVRRGVSKWEEIFEYELTICKLSSQVDTDPASAWWFTPPNFANPEIFVDGYSLDGEFGGVGYLYENNTETRECYRKYFRYYTSRDDGSSDLEVTVRPGYSGSPIWYQGKILGTTWGGSGRYWTDPYNPNADSKGFVHPMYTVFGEYWMNFPPEYQPPAEPIFEIHNKFDGTIELILKVPANSEFKVVATPQLKSPSWAPIEEFAGFLGTEVLPKPWEKILRFDSTSAPSMFFKVEEVPAPIEMGLMEKSSTDINKEKQKQLNVEDIHIVPAFPLSRQ